MDLVQAVESYRLWPEGLGFESRSPRIAQARVRLATNTLPQTPHRAGALCTGYALSKSSRGRFIASVRRRNTCTRFILGDVQWTNTGKTQAASGLIHYRTYIGFKRICLFSWFSSSCPCCFQKFAYAMRMLRRSGKIREFVSIFVNEKQV